jgi:hypothetical protein
MTTREVLAVFQLVNGAAVRALGGAGVRHVQVNLGVVVPDLHIGQRAGAEHTTLVVQVFRQEFNNSLCFGHGQTFVSQWAYFGLRPLTMSKKAVWIFSVMGPRLPT